MDPKILFEIAKEHGILNALIYIVLFCIYGYFVQLYLKKKVQGFINDGEKELEKLRTQYKKELHIHELRFNKEFEIYQALWDKAIIVRMATHELRPFFNLGHQNSCESSEEQGNPRVQKLNNALTEFHEVVYNQQPFYAPEVFESADLIWKTAAGEKVDYLNDPPHSIEYWRNRQNNINAIEELSDKLCADIRKRIYYDN